MADEDPRYQDGVAALKDDVEGAIRIFTELLEESVTKWGETALECAPPYYQYGNALILKVEDSDEGPNITRTNRSLTNRWRLIGRKVALCLSSESRAALSRTGGGSLALCLCS